MSPPPEAADQVGAATLERMAAAPRYNRWMFDRLRPWVGRRVLEIGAGIGNMSAFLVDRERVVLSDTEGSVRKAYMVKKSLRLFAGRVSFVIDKKGVIRHIFSSQTRATVHVGEALNVLKSIS